MFFGTSLVDPWRQAATYADRIVKGARPADRGRGLTRQGRSPRPTRSAAGRQGLPAEHHVDAGQDEFELCPGQLSRTIGQRGFVERDDLRSIGTESFESPVIFDSRSTFPGASAQRSVLVSGTHTTVSIRLRLNASPCTTMTGRRKPGSEPEGSGRSAHQISPCAHHDERRSVRLAAAVAKVFSSGVSAQRLSSVSVTCSGPCRATNSRRARL